MLLCEGTTISSDALRLHPGLVQAPPAEEAADSEETLNLVQSEVLLITQALEQSEWNVTKAAKLLGISRDTLRYRMEKYEVRPPA